MMSTENSGVSTSWGCQEFSGLDLGDVRLNKRLIRVMEWKALYCVTHKTNILPKKLPTVSEVIVWIAKLGGFLGRKSDGKPGVTVIWRGWQRLSDISNTFALFHEVGQNNDT